MKIAVPVKFVPDLVEELTIDPSGVALDTTWLRLIINEFDELFVCHGLFYNLNSSFARRRYSRCENCSLPIIYRCPL